MMMIKNNSNKQVFDNQFGFFVILNLAFEIVELFQELDNHVKPFKRPNSPHMSFLHIQVNSKHKYAQIFLNPEFQNEIIGLLKCTKDMSLGVANNYVQKLGEYYCLCYNDDNSLVNNITEKWRPKFYDTFKTYAMLKENGNDVYFSRHQTDDYVYYFYGPIQQHGTTQPNLSNACFAVPTYYHGHGVFNPHISLYKVGSPMSEKVISQHINKQISLIDQMKSCTITIGKTLVNPEIKIIE
jgi:hypothetical protein